MTLKDKEILLFSWLNTASPIAAEIMSAAGFDALVVDAEHSAVELPQGQALFQAIKSGNPNCVPMVRMAGNRYEQTKRWLDAGALGIIAPLINTGEEARELVRAVKYPPLGERGVGYGRSHGYGYNFDEYMERANRETFVIVQLEHVKALDKLDDILSTEGVDGAFIGPYDLTASMGITAQFDHPDYIQACDKILESCKAHNVMAGIHVVQPDPDEALRRIQQGYQIIAYSLDITMLGNACRDGIQQIRQGKST